jgi:hypothetical protein
MHTAVPTCERLIGTGTRVPIRYPKSGEDPFAHRALIIRETCIRPAHFMRAVFYGPPIASSTDFPSDAIRTRSAILAFGKADVDEITQGLFDASRSRTRAERILSQLREFLKRAAQQLACARAKRIMHGSLTASNISLDGRWIDYGSITSVSDYGRILIARGAPDFMHEEELIRNSIRDFVFYLQKYDSLSVNEVASDISEASLWSDFVAELNDRLYWEFLKLTGMSETQLALVPTDARWALYYAMVTIASSGNRTPFTILSQDNDYVPTMPEKMGDYRLNSIMIRAALAKSLDAIDFEVARELPNNRLRAQFVDAYRQVCSAFRLSSTSSKAGNLDLIRRLNSLRLNTSVEGLYRTNLYPAIDAWAESGQNVASFVSSHIEDSIACLVDYDGNRLNLGPWFGTQFSVSESECDATWWETVMLPRLRGLEKSNFCLLDVRQTCARAF